ncbi:hypothetical protein BDQ17DRAFT_1325694 [Cyathus striatus]|nr:hypothetical protein BDQ17DRAFT_1325694 [Cyathus striatus]
MPYTEIENDGRERKYKVSTEIPPEHNREKDKRKRARVRKVLGLHRVGVAMTYLETVGRVVHFSDDNCRGAGFWRRETIEASQTQQSTNSKERIEEWNTEAGAATRGMSSGVEDIGWRRETRGGQEGGERNHEENEWNPEEILSATILRMGSLVIPSLYKIMRRVKRVLSPLSDRAMKHARGNTNNMRQKVAIVRIRGSKRQGMQEPCQRGKVK